MYRRVGIFWKLSAASLVVFAAVLLALEFVSARWPAWSNIWSFWALAAAVVLSWLATWLIVKASIKKPMHDLQTGMNHLAEKDFSYRLGETDRNEFRGLAESFNEMASMLSASMAEVQKSRDYLSGVLDSSTDIILTLNPSDYIRSINRGAEQTLGYRREELIGQPVDVLLTDPSARHSAAELLKHSDSVVNYETKFVRGDGRSLDVLFSLSRLRNPDGAVIGTIGIGKDITEFKDLQEQLIQSQRLAAVGEVFTGLQHSMKNMLNACKGGAYMVRLGLSKDDRPMLVDGWDMVQEGISKMTAMSRDMLRYVKEWKPRLAETDLTESLQSVHQVIAQTARDRGVEVRLDLPDRLPGVSCDPKMIHSAVMDIVSNAVDACVWKAYPNGENPEVVVSAYPSPGNRELTLEVCDNGCGMTEEVMAKVFRPFFTTKSKAGTGLGLAVTTRMINVHGGRIDVDSEPEIGSTFRIVLPIASTYSSKEKANGQEGSGS